MREEIELLKNEIRTLQEEFIKMKDTLEKRIEDMYIQNVKLLDMKDRNENCK